jgi:hypothetical protein
MYRRINLLSSLSSLTHKLHDMCFLNKIYSISVINELLPLEFFLLKNVTNFIFEVIVVMVQIYNC